MAVPPPTPQLAFREMTPNDLDDMAALLGDPEVMRYYPHPKNRDQALAWISWNQRLYRTHGYGLWLLSLRDTGVFVGDCGLTPQQVDGVTEIEVGYHVRACLQGRGLGTEAAGACRDYARDVLEVDRLVAIIDPTTSHPTGRREPRPDGCPNQRQRWPLEQQATHLRCVAVALLDRLVQPGGGWWAAHFSGCVAIPKVRAVCCQRRRSIRRTLLIGW
jgi:RimJ/RimL family protein N-acetyltransferase